MLRVIPTVGIMLLGVCGGCLEPDVEEGRVPPASRESLAPAKEFVATTSFAYADNDGAGAVIESFRAAYVKHGKPQIVVFVNRKLSEPVPEWQNQIVARETHTTEVHGQPKETQESTTAVSVENAPPKPPTSWVWAFEDGMLQPLLQAKADVIDRSGIDGRESTQPADAVEAVTSDIIVEVLVLRRPSVTGGYEFRATAKDGRRGKMIAHITSLSWSIEARPRRIAFVDSRGYGVAEWDRLLPPELIGSALMVDLMRAMLENWGE